MMHLRTLFACFAWLCLVIKGGIASTCYLTSHWSSWSDCSNDCFGTRVRSSRAVPLPPDCNHIMVTSVVTIRDDYGSCNTVCYNGYNTGDKCRCSPGYTGRCCRNRISCGYPDRIAHGVISYSNTYYGATTTYKCNHHYKLTGGNDVRTCTSNSVWSGTKPSCVYVNHCASKPCQNGATCTDLLDDFQCRCQSGWSGSHCEQDTQAPVMSDCPSDQTVYTTTHTLHINWTEPTFVDPMGKDIRVTANYQTSEFTFPWGDFTVQYVATKPNNGLQTECSFQFHVRPTACDDLNIPVHGARVCNGWKTDYGRFCMVTCQTSYTIDPTSHSYDTLYVCGASGNWTASSPLPDCKIHMSDVASITTMQPSYHAYSYNSTCNDPASKLAIQTLYINTITADESFKEFCSKYADECVPQNVLVDC